MDHKTAQILKDSYLNYYKTFDQYRLEELDLKQPGYSNNDEHINFLYNRSNNNLILTGYYGNAIFSFFNNHIDCLTDVNDEFADNPVYFASRCVTSSRPLYVYDEQLARTQIVHWLQDHNAQNLNWSTSALNGFRNCETLINAILYYLGHRITGFDSYPNSATLFNDDSELMLALTYIDLSICCCPVTWGKTINPLVRVWLHALELGIRWHKQQLVK